MDIIDEKDILNDEKKKVKEKEITFSFLSNKKDEYLVLNYIFICDNKKEKL